MKAFTIRNLLFIPLLAILCTSGCKSNYTPPLITNESNQSFQAFQDGPIENLYQLQEGFYSGGEPKNRAAYEQLASLGIRTVISVDAVAPDASLAGEYNIRVIHLPTSYDGINESRVKELAFAIQSTFKPIYVHCHHGKHRGPAALCAGAIATGYIDQDKAQSFMTKAGTSKHYPGLWDSVKQTRKLDSIKPVTLTEKAHLEGFAESMAEIDRANEQLWLCIENKLRAPEDHPDLSASSLAGQIHDMLRSLTHDETTQTEGFLFEEYLKDSIVLASQVEQSITNQDPDGALISMEKLTESCVECHSRFRD
ncbi:MAG: hypothetical protein P1U42_01140 [Phycisphaerales bacterium]|nr:hypothetical protein [Phycisphaerales bacterium]